MRVTRDRLSRLLVASCGARGDPPSMADCPLCDRPGGLSMGLGLIATDPPRPWCHVCEADEPDLWAGIYAAFERAGVKPPPRLLEEEAEQDAAPGFVRLSEVEERPIEWFWPGRVPYAHTCGIAGDGGVGKSTLAQDLGSRMTRGHAPPGGAAGDPRAVVMQAAASRLAQGLPPWSRTPPSSSASRPCCWLSRATRGGRGQARIIRALATQATVCRTTALAGTRTVSCEPT